MSPVAFNSPDWALYSPPLRIMSFAELTVNFPPALTELSTLVALELTVSVDSWLKKPVERCSYS